MEFRGRLKRQAAYANKRAPGPSEGDNQETGGKLGLGQPTIVQIDVLRLETLLDEEFPEIEDGTR